MVDQVKGIPGRTASNRVNTFSHETGLSLEQARALLKGEVRYVASSAECLIPLGGELADAPNAEVRACECMRCEDARFLGEDNEGA